MPVSLQEFNHWEALTGYKEHWTHLLAQTPGAHFFQSWDWLAAYWQHFQANQKLRVFFHWEGTNLRGIVPLVVRWEKPASAGFAR